MQTQRVKFCALACAIVVSCGAYAQTTGTPTSSSPQTAPTSPTTAPLPTEPPTPNTPPVNPQAGTSTLPEAPPTGVPPTTTPPTETPPVTPPPAGTANPNGVANATTTGATANQMFARLDTTQKGYLTRTDVASDAWLSTNFTSCDRNSDGRLDRGEVASCMQSHPRSE